MTELADLSEELAEDTPSLSEDGYGHMDVEIERVGQPNMDVMNKTTLNDVDSMESLSFGKCRYEGKSVRSESSVTTNVLQNMDDTDMFFLSMSNMTKRLPKVEQARIKLALSNSVLSAEVRCNE